MPSHYQSALTPEDIASLLKMSKANVYRKIKTGEIPAKKIGKEYRISATFIWYFQTGMDFDIYERQKEDESILHQYQQVLQQARKQV